MRLNPPSGQMYSWCWTANPLQGFCHFDCSYCYVGRKIGPWLSRMGNPKYQGDPGLVESELTIPIRKPDDGCAIFVGSCIDLCHPGIHDEWIKRILHHCQEYPRYEYLFQSKDPKRFTRFSNDFPPMTILGTTIESNRNYNVTRAPQAVERKEAMVDLANTCNRILDFKRMVSIEPIMKFDLSIMLEWITEINPCFVSIGADSLGCGLEEPSGDDLRELIEALDKFTEVRLKMNLNRLLKSYG